MYSLQPEGLEIAMKNQNACGGTTAMRRACFNQEVSNMKANATRRGKRLKYNAFGDAISQPNR